MGELKDQVANAVIRAYRAIGVNLSRDLRSAVVIHLHPAFLAEIRRDDSFRDLLLSRPSGGFLLMGFEVRQDTDVARGAIAMHLHLERVECVDA